MRRSGGELPQYPQTGGRSEGGKRCETSGIPNIRIRFAKDPCSDSKNLQNLEKNVDGGKVAFSQEDVQAVREVADKASVAHVDRHPEDHMKSLFADISSLNLAIVTR